jgi:hypothetical protein
LIERSQQENQSDERRSKCDDFLLNCKLISRALKHKEIYRPMIFFIITGILIPNLEDALYYFLLDTCGLSKEQYSFLNISQSIGIILGTSLYIGFFRTSQVWVLISISMLA